MADEIKEKASTSYVSAVQDVDAFLAALKLPARYSNIQLIGQGGMGLVLRVSDSLLQRDVAIKLLLFEGANDDEQKARFLRETKILASLEHDNIIRILSFGITDEGIPYYVMELLHGHSLSQELSKNGKLAPARFFEIMNGVIAGLAFASESKIVHRDIKPSNIIVSDNVSSGCNAKIIDFGIASQAQEPGAADKSATVTRTGAILGSPVYMSPEQCRGDAATSQSDIYSLACVMYECLTGAPPFMGATAFETMYQHMNAPVPSLEKLATGTSGRDLARLIEKCMQKNPQERPLSVQELQSEFQSIMANQIGKEFGIASNAAKSKTKPLLLVAFILLLGVFGVPFILKNMETYTHTNDADSSFEAMKKKEASRREEQLQERIDRLNRTIQIETAAINSSKRPGHEQIDRLLRFRYCPLLKCLREQRNFEAMKTTLSQVLELFAKHSKPLVDNNKWEILFLTERVDACIALRSFQDADADIAAMESLVNKKINESYKFYLYFSRVKNFIAQNKLESAYAEFAKLDDSWRNIGYEHQLGNSALLNLPGWKPRVYQMIKPLVEASTPQSESERVVKKHLLDYCKLGAGEIKSIDAALEK